MRLFVRTLILASVVALSARALWAQSDDPRPSPSRKAEDKPEAQDDDKPKPVPAAKHVTIPVVVRDKKGAAVEGLTASNFSIKVDSTAQPVSSITLGAAAPVTLGLVVDVGNGQRNAIEGERKAARALIGLLRPGDKMFVVQFAKQIELLQEPTDSRSKLEKALTELGTSSASFTAVEPSRSGVDEEGRKIRSGGTSLCDAVFLSVDEVLSKETNKRVLVVLSDGIDVGSKTSMSEVMESVGEKSVVVFGMYSKNIDAVQDQRKGPGRNGNGNGRPTIGGLPGSYPGGGGGYPGGYPQGGGTGSGGSGGGKGPNGPGSEPERKPQVDGMKALQTMSEKTGGRMFDASKHSSQEDDFAALYNDLRAAYWVTFTPAGAGTRHGYHQFDLLVTGSDKSKKVDVQTSDGFVGGQ